MQEVFKSDLFFAALCKGKHGVDWVQGVDEQIGDLVRDRLSQQLVQLLDLMEIIITRLSQDGSKIILSL